jgi:hydroxymethylbilane synthase
MPKGAVVGTSAPRRRAQLTNRFPHLEFEAIRGNVDTRLNKVRDGKCDGIVLACAGLTRLGRQNAITSYFSVEEIVPAAGQGIVGIEIRRDAARIRGVLASINDSASELAARCERGLLQRFGKQIDCYSAIGVHARIDGGILTLRAAAADYDGNNVVHAFGSRGDPDALADLVYQELIGRGAMDLVLAGER